MSSVVVFSSPNGVVAQWNKGGGYTVTHDDGPPRYYATKEAAIRAAKRKARAIKKEA